MGQVMLIIGSIDHVFTVCDVQLGTGMSGVTVSIMNGPMLVVVDAKLATSIDRRLKCQNPSAAVYAKELFVASIVVLGISAELFDQEYEYPAMPEPVPSLGVLQDTEMCALFDHALCMCVEDDGAGDAGVVLSMKNGPMDA
jgi:hypothetical protein